MGAFEIDNFHNYLMWFQNVRENRGLDPLLTESPHIFLNEMVGFFSLKNALEYEDR